MACYYIKKKYFLLLKSLFWGSNTDAAKSAIEYFLQIEAQVYVPFHTLIFLLGFNPTQSG